MINITVEDIALATGGEFLAKNANSPVRGFSIDSRTAGQGEFFIAIKGMNYDGHDYIAEAFSRRVSGIVVGRARYRDATVNVPNVLLVDDTRLAMGKIAGFIRKKSGIPVVGITGTNGKTTTKEILSHVLSRRFNTLKSPKSFNNMVGLSLTLFGMEPGNDMAVLEIASSHPGEIDELGRIAAPDMAVITNIGRAHLEFFTDRENIFREKTSLLKHVPSPGAVFLNGDDDLLSRIGAGGDRKFFGVSPRCDFRITDIAEAEGGSSFRINGLPFHLPMKGRHNVLNAAAAIAVSTHLGVRPDVIRERLTSVSAPGMRLEKTVLNGIVFINDAYNANPDSFGCALDVMDGLASSGKNILIAGDMLELGPNSLELHEDLGGRIARGRTDFLITVGRLAGSIADGAVKGGMDKDNVFRAGENEEAASLLVEIARPHDIVLMKASRASKLEEIMKCFTISYSR